MRDLPVLSHLVPMDENVVFMLGNPERSLSILAGGKLADAIDLNQPIDAMAGIGAAEGKFAISFGAKAAALNELSLRRVTRGRFVIEEPPGRLFPACELWHAEAPIGVRIVCAGSAVALRDFGPELVVNAKERTAASFRLEVFGEAYRALLAQAMDEQEADEQNMPLAERSGAELGRKWTKTLLAGERVGFDITLAEKAIELAVDFGFHDADSPLFNSWLAASVKAQAVPDAYSALPSDVRIRGALSGIDSDTGRALRLEGVHQVLTAMDEDMVIPKAALGELERGVIGVVPERFRGVFALGQDLDAATRLLAAEDKAGPAPRELEHAIEGWSIFGLEVEPSEYLRAVEDFVKVANHRFPDRVPQPVSGAASAPPRTSNRSDSTLKRRPTPKGLPSGTLHLVDEVRPDPAYRPKAPTDLPPIRAFERHMLIVPDTGLVWIVVSRSQADALARARHVLDKASRTADPRANSPEAVAFLGELSLAGAVTLGLAVETAEQRADARAKFRRLQGLPGQGRAAIPMSLRVTSSSEGGQAGYSMRAVGELSPAVVTDWFRYALMTAQAAPGVKP
jgi:hypothetical protein